QALTLPALKVMPATTAVKAFATTTLSHHRSHLTLFNQTLSALGGRTQTNPDPRYAPLLKSQISQLTKMSPQGSVSGAVELAITVESVAAETYAKNSPTFVSGRARTATASVTGIEAQHVATLRALQALLKTIPAVELSFGPIAALLPASAGDVGFPDAFFPTSLASPADEGAVR
ncbi:MAG: ferritin-like domain-containing protein, partial [Acidimicrobiales bacterium]|nr:ferritin-like domain-containing protein [Acidimicrobiales bacterium]